MHTHAVEGLNYYSNTWDIVAWPSEEDGPMRVVASFTTRVDAVAYLRSDDVKGRGALYVRPPCDVIDDALRFVQYLLAISNGTAQDVDEIHEQMRRGF